MTSSVDTAFTGSVAQFYERYMVPLIFEPYAADLARRVAQAAPRRVLELAAGTGVVTRQLAAMLEASSEIVATDLNPGDDRGGGAHRDRPARGMAAGRRDAAAVRGCLVRCRRVPVRRDVLSRQAAGLRRGAPRAAPGRAVRLQCVGPHRRRTSSPMPSRTRSPRCFPRTRRGSWRAPRMATTTRRASRRTSRRRVSRAHRRSTRWPSPAVPCRRASRRSPTARARRCAGRSKRATRTAWTHATQAAEAELARRFGDGPIEGRIEALVVTARA